MQNPWTLPPWGIQKSTWYPLMTSLIWQKLWASFSMDPHPSWDPELTNYFLGNTKIGVTFTSKSTLPPFQLNRYPMIGISWNIRGLNGRIKKTSLRKLITTHNPDFVFVQETKMDLLSPKIVKSLWNDPDIEWLFSPSMGNSGGLLLMWKSNFLQISSHQINNNWIAISGFFPSLNFTGCLINIYNPCSREDRANVWASLSHYWHNSNSPCLIMGNF